ncbi:MAG: hypothetical protein U5L03_15200 [Burkholderiaceae bacterium]|nr:hypothetical protein [Burkholderiaceae bacterium]
MRWARRLLLAFGLSIEQEARAMVRAVVGTLQPPKTGAAARPCARFVLLDQRRARWAGRRRPPPFPPTRCARPASAVDPVFTPSTSHYEQLRSIWRSVFRAHDPTACRWRWMHAGGEAMCRPRPAHDPQLFAHLARCTWAAAKARCWPTTSKACVR